MEKIYLKSLYVSSILTKDEYSSFVLARRCFVVLISILNDSREHFVLLSLYTEKSKHLWKYFQIQSSDRLNDRCRKLIEGKTGLFFMELVSEHHDKGEIFGVRSVPERKVSSVFQRVKIIEVLVSYGLKNSMKQ